MFAFAVRRLGSAIPTLFIIITIAFFMMRLAPGGPLDRERQLPPEIEANILKAYNLDKPIHEQYFSYLKNILQGDFGPSYKYLDFTVNDLIQAGFPASSPNRSPASPILDTVRMTSRLSYSVSMGIKLFSAKA